VSADVLGAGAVGTPESADFSLSPQEVNRGLQVAEAYLNSLRPGEAQREGEVALGTLAAVLSGGICETHAFPWHQIRGYHGALALSIIREPGAPGQLEALLCRRDDTRKYQQVPDNYSRKQIARIRSALQRVVEEAWNLGFMDDEAYELAQLRGEKKNGSRGNRQRLVSAGEVRALLAVCRMSDGAGDARDSLMIGLAYAEGLRTVDLVHLNLEDLRFNGKNGQVTIGVKAPGAKRARRIPLENDQLISLEDWLMFRGREAGALFCPVGRANAVEVKRMNAASVAELCEKRAEAAGVRPFAPNDLAKSSARNSQNSGRRSSAHKKNGRMAKVSPLYESSESSESGESGASGENEENDPGEQIRFPYRVPSSL
jgi:integrase